MIVPVRDQDRVRDVISRDARLIDVFVAQSAFFEKLRNPVMRRLIAGTVTVEQAARVAGVAPSILVRALNAKLGVVLPEAADAEPRVGPHAPPRHPTGRGVTELDVRDDLRGGREPFARIMSAVRTLGDDLLRVRAPFEPVPLVAVLGRHGFTCETEEHAADDWSLWAWRGAAEPQAEVESTTAARPSGAERAKERADETVLDEIVLDVRGLEPPEPMARTLVALETLPVGATLLQINVRIPQFLLPVLDERGFTYEIDDGRADRVLVRIRRAP